MINLQLLSSEICLAAYLYACPQEREGEMSLLNIFTEGVTLTDGVTACIHSRADQLGRIFPTPVAKAD